MLREEELFLSFVHLFLGRTFSDNFCKMPHSFNHCILKNKVSYFIHFISFELLLSFLLVCSKL